MRKASDLPRDGDQLFLPLGQEEPWGGRSPRALTRARSALYLRPEPPGAMRLVEDCEQLELWPAEYPETMREGPRIYSGAPLLVALSRTRKGRLFSSRGG